MLFRRPAVVTRKTSKIKTASAGQAIDEHKERLAPKYAQVFLSNELFRLQLGLAGNPDSQKLRETKVVICNELRRFFLSYIPDLARGEFTYEEIRDRISQIPEKRKRELLVILTNQLEYHENHLYYGDPGVDLINQIIATRKQVGDLNDWKIWLFNKRQKWQRLSTQFKGLFRRAK